MNGLCFASVVLGLAISWLGCFVVRRWAPAWGLLDAPDSRKNHAAPTPLGGGLAIGLSVLGALLLLLGRCEPSTLLLAGGGAMLALGLIDDRWEVSWKLRLAIELLVAGCFAGYSLWWLPELSRGELWRPALAALWIVAQLNAINMFDNMDGLAAGVAGIASAFLAALILWAPPPAEPLAALSSPASQPIAAQTDGVLVDGTSADGVLIDRASVEGGKPVLSLDAALPLAMFGALVGFLWHNRAPARLFLGDGGSYFIGFLLGAISALSIAAAVDRPWPARFAPVCVLLVPLYDMVSVVTIRLLAGRSPFVGDRNHVSHRLAALGLGQRKAVLLLYAATFVTGLAGLIVERASPVVGMGTFASLGTMAALAGGAEFLAHRKMAHRVIDHA